MNPETIVASISSRGQITIPARIREFLHISHAGDLIGFVPTQEGVLLKHVEIKEEEFSEDEWDKLEKLANQKGKTYKSANDFLKALKKL